MPYNPNLYVPYSYPYYPQPISPAPVNFNTNIPTVADTNTQQMPINGFIPVAGIEGAKAYALPPNSKVPLFDDKEDIFYKKTTDEVGFPEIRKFKFVEIKDDDTVETNTEYVTRKDFDELADRFNVLIAKMADKDKA